ncbi:hypothetical protein VKT23_000149 [Stygiomarasmius scandens]|uniref:Uncharacterized protein n=1 Tax=Marasmiellus scandens TaxID=2682957 RepID=A0ABR1K8R5_9AGAR
MISFTKLQILLVSTVLTCTLSTFAAPAGTGDLVVKLSATSKVDGVDDLKVEVTVTNTGTEPIALLKDPRTMLVNSGTKTFDIVSKSGDEKPVFEGKTVKFVPERMKKKEDFWLKIPGQKSIKVEHTFSVYDFTKSGEGLYKITPSSTALDFNEVDTKTFDLKKVKGTLDTKTPYVEVNLQGDLVSESSQSQRSSSQGSSQAVKKRTA